MTGAEYWKLALLGLAKMSAWGIAEASGVSMGCAARAQRGDVLLYQRHWNVISSLAAFEPHSIDSDEDEG